MKIEKVIMSCDDSHYQYYWPVVAKTCKKTIKATPVLFKITDNDNNIFIFPQKTNTLTFSFPCIDGGGLLDINTNDIII